MITREAAGELISAHGLRTGGAPLHRCGAVMVALHGRGANGASILEVADALAQPEIAFLAPEAPSGAWYPRPFIAPIAENEPDLSEALGRVRKLLDDLETSGIGASRIGVMGFSQGACLALESVIRRPRPYGAVLGLSGGYIGPMGMARTPAGDLTGAAVFLGCSDVDSHIPAARVRETAALMRAMGAEVTERLYPGMGHLVNASELAESRRLLVAMLSRPA